MERTLTLQKAANLVSKNFSVDISQSQFPEADEDAYQFLRKKLAQEIDRLLGYDFERLMQAFYRIDVDEAKVRHLIFGSGTELVSEALADLVIQRQIEKVRNWEKYSQFV